MVVGSIALSSKQVSLMQLSNDSEIFVNAPVIWQKNLGGINGDQQQLVEPNDGQEDLLYNWEINQLEAIL